MAALTGKLGITSYAHGVDNLHLDGFDVDWQGAMPDFYVSGVKADAFKNICIDDFTGRGPRGNTPAILLRDGQGVTVRESLATSGELLLLDRVGGPKLIPDSK